MNYQIYKLDFQSSVHFGSGGLTRGKNTLCADTFFSALCQEANKASELEYLLEKVQNDEIRFSDALPYIGDTYYVPKPLVQLEIEKNGNSSEKKALNRLEYVPVNKLESFLQGEMDIRRETKYFSDAFGKAGLVEKVALDANRESEPYAVARFTYAKNSGLYVIVGTKDMEQQLMVSELLESLQYEGLGGKRSSGYGRFVIKTGKPDKAFQDRLCGNDYKIYATLSACLPKEAELEECMEQARYRLIKRSGFVDSNQYADSFRKKKDSYLFAAGATFEKRFTGEISDVSTGGNHPVYRYAKPIFMGVK